MTTQSPSIQNVNFNYTIPADAGGGLTYARFRYNTNTISTPTGAGGDGEVEDYTYNLCIDEGGLIDGDEESCGAFNPGLILSQTTPLGVVTYYWEKRTQNCSTGVYGDWEVISGATAAVYDPPSISVTTQYRRVASADGCTGVFPSNEVTKTVVQNFSDGGEISGDDDDCNSIDPAELTSVSEPSGGCNGTTEYQWQYREFIDDAWTAWSVISGATGLTYDPGPVTVTTEFRRRARRAPCTSWKASNSITINVNGFPEVTIDSVNDQCTNDSPVTLTGSPAGGTFSGTGVSGSQFDPAVAGVGTHAVTYTYTDVNGCSDAASTRYCSECFSCSDA